MLRDLLVFLHLLETWALASKELLGINSTTMPEYALEENILHNLGIRDFKHGVSIFFSTPIAISYFQ